MSRRAWLKAAGSSGALGLTHTWSRVIEPMDLQRLVVRQPAIFVAHGAPDLAVSRARGPAYRAWGARLARPRGIVAMTPHFRAEELTLGALGPGRALFRFPRRFLPGHGELGYASPDNDALADRVRALIGDRLHPPRRERSGTDHTTWMPLHHLIPDASVPVLELSMPFASPRQLFDLGHSLASLRHEGVMVMASGNLTHNLAMLGRPGEPAPWARAFDEWMVAKLSEGDLDALLDFRRAAPDAYLAHPDGGEHYSVLAFALGAALGDGGELRPSFPIEGFSPGSISNRCVELA
jgi:4,5-DOPA dioxygenase extradiol